MNITNAIFSKVNAAGATDFVGVPKVGAGTGEIAALESLTSLVNFVLNLIFGIGLALALLFVVIGGIKYITSQGDEGKATEARNTITNAIIGAVVIIAFRLILNLAISILTGGTLDNYLQGGS